MKRAELLSPAGNFEKLEAAVRYGADAVYLAGKEFGMRTASQNLTEEELAAAVAFCHERRVRLYVTVNVMPRTEEYPALRAYLRFLGKVGVDALIVSDLGVFMAAREEAPETELHISTQASAVSAEACLAWHRLGAKRVVLARELTLSDIRTIRAAVPEELELEVFLHGAMCVAYSGRCLLSNYFTGRDANHGNCVQACRWQYAPSDEDRPDFSIDLKEENRPDLPVALSAEQVKGETFFLSSRDLCMIRHIPELEEAGIASYKIEGRVKSAYYTAVVTNTYRMALDRYRADPAGYRFDEAWQRELDGVSHREYGTGFFFGPPMENANTVTKPGYIRDKAYLASALEAHPDGDGAYVALFVQRNKLNAGDTVELISPGRCGRAFRPDGIWDEDGAPLPATPHPGMRFRLRVPFEVKKGDILRLGTT